MFCKKCGNELKDGEKICSKCGEALDKNIVLNKKKNSNLLLIIVVVILIFIGFLIMLFGKNGSDIFGTWKCRNWSWTTNSLKDQYTLTLKLGKDKKFSWETTSGTYSYVKGTYSFNGKKSSNNYLSNTSKNSTNTKTYMLELIANESSTNITKGTKLTYEMQILNDSKEAVIINPSNYRMYYCNLD